jgi:DNA-directed RNA polymerase specialized sigma24 family protein
VAEEARLMRDDTLLAGKGAYTAVYSREPDGTWIVYIRGHRHEIHTFARSLRTARESIRDALSVWYDDANSATIVDRIELEPALEEELAEAEELARRHSDLSRELAAKRRRTVRALQSSGMGTRDIAELLELSQQRVSQIARGTR